MIKRELYKRTLTAINEFGTFSLSFYIFNLMVHLLTVYILKILTFFSMFSNF